MYSDLLAYDEVCKSVLRDKQKINTELNNTEMARSCAHLKTELNNLVGKNKQLLAELKKLNTEYNSCVEKYNECLKAFRDEAEDFDGRKDDTDIESSEFEECRKELEKLRNTAKKIEQTILKIASRADEITKTLDANVADGKKKNKQFKQAQEKLNDEIKAHAADMAELDAKKEEAGKKVDASLRETYDRIAESHRDPISWVSNGRCSGCNMTLPSSKLGKVGTEVLLCENCGRMILGNK